MIPLLRASIDCLAALHQGAEQSIAGLPTEALDWVPAASMNSIAMLVTHMAGAERYWIGDMIGQDPSGRDRAAEFLVRDQRAEDLVALLAKTQDHSREVLESLPETELAAARVSPRDGKSYSVAWCLVHALEHTALHLGHLQITRQLWANRA